MDWRIVFIIARKEVRGSLRNRWFVLYTLAFAVLALSLSYLSLIGTGYSGLAGFGRTTAGLVNLVLLIVPLMALTVGAASVAGDRERGTLVGLLAQPVSRMEVFAGKFVGLTAALAAALLGGFGASGLLIAVRGQADSAGSYLLLVGLTLALAVAMLGVGLLVSVLCRRSSAAIGAAIFLWLGLAFLSDLGLMGGTVAFRLQADQLLHLALLNPLEVFKMAVLHGVHATLDALGPAGSYAAHQYGSRLPWIFAAALGAWIVAPLAAAGLLFAWKEQV